MVFSRGDVQERGPSGRYTEWAAHRSRRLYRQGWLLLGLKDLLERKDKVEEVKLTDDEKGGKCADE